MVPPKEAGPEAEEQKALELATQAMIASKEVVSGAE